MYENNHIHAISMPKIYLYQQNNGSPGKAHAAKFAALPPPNDILKLEFFAPTRALS
jgi:hypothetical protein